MSPFPSFQNITVEWLTEVLQTNGHLTRGSVNDIHLQPLSDVPFSGPKIRRLEIEYSQDPLCPEQYKVILKTASKEKEYFFYSQIIEWMGEIPVPNCYLAQQNEDKSQAIFLLEDLSNTHSQTEWPIPPSFELCETAIDCLSLVHAFWWNHPQLETELREKVTKGNYWTGRLDEAIDKLSGFLDFIGDRLSTERKGIYEKFLASSNHYWMPDNTRNGKTFLHVDIHFWNFLFPNDPYL